MTRDQFLNVLAFLILMTNEDAPAAIGDKSPTYITEKWDRYIGSSPPEGPCWQWGLHTTLRTRAFDPYVQHWTEQLDELFGPVDQGES